MARARRAAAASTRSSAGDDGEPMRLRILRGAAVVFGARGYAATSVESILAEAGTSRRTFYKHFRSKDDVLRVLFENSVSMLLAAVRDTQRAPRATGDRLAAAIEGYLEVHARAGKLARVLLLEQFSPSSPLAQQRDQAMVAFADLIEEGFAREGRPPPDPMLVHGVVAAINAIAVHMATEDPDRPFDLERAKQAMLRILAALTHA
jgi:AcrR family transcriptional regulator